MKAKEEQQTNNELPTREAAQKIQSYQAFYNNQPIFDEDENDDDEDDSSESLSDSEDESYNEDSDSDEEAEIKL